MLVMIVQAAIPVTETDLALCKIISIFTHIESNITPYVNNTMKCATLRMKCMPLTCGGEEHYVHCKNGSFCSAKNSCCNVSNTM